MPRSKNEIYAFMAWCSVKIQEQLYLYLNLCVFKYNCEGRIGEDSY